MNLSHFIAGGWLAGKRTYLLAFTAVVAELARWAVGEQSLGALVDLLPQIFGDLGLAALRAGVAAAIPTPAQAADAVPLSACINIPLDEDVPDAVRDWIRNRKNRP